MLLAPAPERAGQGAGGGQAALFVGYAFPVDFAINGIVRINQLGASLSEVAQDWRGLWFLAVIYFALAVFSAYVVKQRGTRLHD